MDRMESRKAARKQYLKDVQAIVGQENYVKFLEENYTDGGIKHDKNGLRAGKGKKDNKKGMRAGKKGDKKGLARHSKANMRQGSQYMSHKRVKMS